jgi:hypothetical protein
VDDVISRRQYVCVQVWILDSPLGKWTSDRPTDTDKVINEILNIPLPVPSRRWLYQYMAQRGYSEAITQWLGSNLVPDNGGLKWAFNISGASIFCHFLHRIACLEHWLAMLQNESTPL